MTEPSEGWSVRTGLSCCAGPGKPGDASRVSEFLACLFEFNGQFGDDPDQHLAASAFGAERLLRLGQFPPDSSVLVGELAHRCGGGVHCLNAGPELVYEVAVVVDDVAAKPGFRSQLGDGQGTGVECSGVPAMSRSAAARIAARSASVSRGARVILLLRYGVIGGSLFVSFDDDADLGGLGCEPGSERAWCKRVGGSIAEGGEPTA